MLAQFFETMLCCLSSLKDQQIPDIYLPIISKHRPHASLGGYFNLMLCSVMLPHFICKIWCLNEQNLMLCYAVLWFVMLTYFMSKILCSQWVKSCDLLCSHFWEIMIEIFVSKTLCTVMNSYLMSKILLDLMKLTVSYCNQE